MQTIDSRIHTFITENFLFGDTQRELGLSDSLIENDIIDSTGVLELVMFVEDAFGMIVEDSEIVPDNFDSIIKIRNFVLSKTVESAA